MAILRVKNGLDYSGVMGEDSVSPLHKSNTSNSLKGGWKGRDGRDGVTGWRAAGRAVNT